MLSPQLTDIDADLLTAACNERWSETETLDFKETLPGIDDRSKQEFAKDVCAFANANGGDLVFGIRDEQGHAAEVTPIDPAANPLDATRRRLGQLLESNIEPKVDGTDLPPALVPRQGS